jgi:hypothetical protein
MTPIAETAGFLVADVEGEAVGRVECPLYGRAPHEPDAIVVRSGMLLRRHFLVPVSTIVAIDNRQRTIELRVGRRQLRRFL